jgi:hypothetical protein
MPFDKMPFDKMPFDKMSHFSLHGWFFYGGSTSDKKTSVSGWFWFIILAASMSAAVFVMGTNIQGCYFIFSFFKATTLYNTYIEIGVV